MWAVKGFGMMKMEDIEKNKIKGSFDLLLEHLMKSADR